MAVRRGGYWGYFRHDWDEAARRFMTDTVEKGVALIGEQ